MKGLKIVGIGLLAIVVIGVIGIMVLPSHTHLERSTVINAKPDQVYAVVNDYQNFNKWSPWAKLDPDTKYEFSGATSGIGATMKWVSENDQVGIGTQKIVESEENKRVKNEMIFSGMDGKSYADIILTPGGTGTKVTWTYDGDMGGLYKVFGLMMDSMLGPFYEQGLASMKEYVESRNELEPLEEGEMTPADSTVKK